MTMLSAVLLLVGCSGNEYEDWQSPQSHDEDDAIVIPGLTASPVGVINFNDITLSDDFDLQACPMVMLSELRQWNSMRAR